ncbi:hypothetical protein DBV15_07446 [Temnothorax longispinosus]|uniref:Uncharacterized protein n=1 Tax=Temnothorax longispinosus TaxID=300112 RepID=A0A4S2JBM0_9HYME|nr:hypothetical protein DBV15_07446 [Temnothorax longispinosus]
MHIPILIYAICEKSTGIYAPPYTPVIRNDTSYPLSHLPKFLCDVLFFFEVTIAALKNLAELDKIVTFLVLDVVCTAIFCGEHAIRHLYHNNRQDRLNPLCMTFYTSEQESLTTLREIIDWRIAEKCKSTVCKGIPKQRNTRRVMSAR